MKLFSLLKGDTKNRIAVMIGKHPKFCSEEFAYIESMADSLFNDHPSLESFTYETKNDPSFKIKREFFSVQTV